MSAIATSHGSGWARQSSPGTRERSKARGAFFWGFQRTYPMPIGVSLLPIGRVQARSDARRPFDSAHAGFCRGPGDPGSLPVEAARRRRAARRRTPGAAGHGACWPAQGPAGAEGPQARAAQQTQATHGHTEAARAAPHTAESVETRTAGSPGVRAWRARLGLHLEGASAGTWRARMTSLKTGEHGPP
jgi:hypothetical protein